MLIIVSTDEVIIKKEIVPYLAPQIKSCILRLNREYCSGLEEIRLRCGKPLLIKVGNREWAIDRNGQVTRQLEKGYQVNPEDIFRTIALISDNSLYAFADDIKRGFITIPGGHRVGLAGQVILDGNQIKTIKDFSGIAFRIAREIKNCSEVLLPYICDSNTMRPVNTILISPPRCGKTTILRDLARVLSCGNRVVKACNVVIVDERSELAGCYQGVPQLDVGPRTDVLDSCPKALGMYMAVRSLSPEVIITDEIGRTEDIDAIRECVNAGVIVVTSIHAGSKEELEKKPLFKELLAIGAFQLGIILSRRSGPGSIEDIIRWD